MKKNKQHVWACRVGAKNASLRDFGDARMREAVERAFKEETGKEPDFIFSDWTDELTDSEKSALRRSSE